MASQSDNAHTNDSASSGESGNQHGATEGGNENHDE